MSEIKVGSIKGLNATSAAISIDNSSGSATANLTTVNSVTMPNGGSLSNRNLVINGAMQVAQRGATFNSASSAQVVTDRFRFEHGGSGLTDVINITQKSNAARDIGFEHSLKAEVATVDSSLASDHFTQFKYQIEAQDIVKQSQYGLSSAKQMTLSFYVKCSVTGTFPLALNDGTGSRSNPHVYTINSANTWERKTITFNGDTGGNWQNQANNGAGFGIRWGLAIGSGFFGTADGNWSADSSYAQLYASYSNSFITTQGATWELTGVQLEIGSTATDFEHKSNAQVLALCQRYFQIMKVTTAMANTTTNLSFTAPLLCKMRATPSIGKTSGDFKFGDMVAVGATSSSTPALDTSYYNHDIVITGGIGGFSGMTVYRLQKHEPNASQPALITADAEL